MSSSPIGTRFMMRQRLISIGDDYDIKNQDGVHVGLVDGKMLRLRDTLALKDAHGNECYTIQKKMIRVRNTMGISKKGQEVAQVQRALVNPLRERFKITMREGDDMTVKGNILDHEFTIKRAGKTVAYVSKKWFTVRDSYGIEVVDDEDPYLLLAIAVCVDNMAHENSNS